MAGMAVLGFLVGTGIPVTQALAEANSDSRDDASPWGMGSSAEWSREYPKFDPMLDQAGVRWLRLWNEWQEIEPKRGQFNWEGTDKIVADAKANHLHLLPTWAYFAPWASADGGTRRGPIKDLQFWREYVSASVSRYRADIKYWEVWNEFNGSFYQGKNRPKEYAELVVAASDAAKAADPSAKIGMSVANFDVGFLDAAIKAGAANHFDFICVHPYENLGAVGGGGEMGYLSLVGNLRAMLKANQQPDDLPLWITEVGYAAPVKADPTADAKQAEMLVKGELLSVVQGFRRIFWFEARGPAYGHGTDLGIIRPDWTQRPAYGALKVLTTLLGPEPKYLGWLDVDQGAYGFLFQGTKAKVLAAWAPPGKEHKAKFAATVNVTDLTGAQTPLEAGRELVLTARPVFIASLPENLAALAESNLGKRYPWGGDYAHAQTVSCGLGAVNREDGLKQINPHTTVVVNGLADTCVRPDFANPALHDEGRYIYFRVDPQFVPYGTTRLEVTIVARRLAADKPANMSLTYESASHGYTGAGKTQELPADENWHEINWDLKDVNFVGQWGWNFRFEATGSPNEFFAKEVRVKKL
jgi:polysaccharide biosynthesis protein PslG